MNETESTAIVPAASHTPALLRPIAKPAQLMEVHAEVVAFLRDVLIENTDFGTIPGAGKKKSLFKAGAERICAGFGIRAEYELIESEVDHDAVKRFSLVKWVAAARAPGREEKERLKAEGKGRNKKTGDGWEWQVPIEESGEALGLYRFVIRCRLFRGETELGQGVGSCSSLESKYIRTPRDMENTVLKMAKKRAYVDAVLTTCSLSDRFTQDAEDIQANATARGERSSEEPEVQEGEYREESKKPTDEGPSVPEEELARRKKNAAANKLITAWQISPESLAGWKESCKKRNLDAVETLLAVSKADGVKDFDDADKWLFARFPLGNDESEPESEVEAEPSPKTPSKSNSATEPPSTTTDATATSAPKRTAPSTNATKPEAVK